MLNDVVVVGDVSGVKSVKPDYLISFHNDNGEMVGALDFNGSELVFTGNANEAAKIFIEWLAELFRERLAEERERCAKLCDGVDANLAEVIRQLK